MSKKFDSSIVGQPYSRVMSIGIQYTATMTATVDVILQQHVKLLDGSHTPLGSSETLTFGIAPADFATGTVQLRDVSTGVLLGATMTMGQLFTGVASLIREKELAAEAAANPQVDPVEPVDPVEGV